MTNFPIKPCQFTRSSLCRVHLKSDTLEAKRREFKQQLLSRRPTGKNEENTRLFFFQNHTSEASPSKVLTVVLQTGAGAEGSRGTFCM